MDELGFYREGNRLELVLDGTHYIMNIPRFDESSSIAVWNFGLRLATLVQGAVMNHYLGETE